ncbi:MAG: DUF1122 family protein [Dehalococcoidia bacterium]|nr:DUF1122 family protein [Dehalococcoidia bacterium]
MPTEPWRPAPEAEDVKNIPIAFLDGSPLGAFTTRVYLGPKNSVGATYFQFVIVDGSGRESQPVLQGLSNTGEYPAYNWIEVSFFQPRVALIATETARAAFVDLREAGLEEPLFKRLADLLPPGGHLMVEYDSPEQEETRLGLERGFPPAATPVGSLLYRVGCGLSFKDWYFAEGGSEGPRKLQCFKPLNEELARSHASLLAQEMEAFLATGTAEQTDHLKRRAIEQAHKILKRVREDGKPERKQDSIKKKGKSGLQRLSRILQHLRGKGKSERKPNSSDKNGKAGKGRK